MKFLHLRKKNEYWLYDLNPQFQPQAGRQWVWVQPRRVFNPQAASLKENTLPLGHWAAPQLSTWAQTWTQWSPVSMWSLKVVLAFRPPNTCKVTTFKQLKYASSHSNSRQWFLKCESLSLKRNWLLIYLLTQESEHKNQLKFRLLGCCSTLSTENQADNTNWEQRTIS